MELTLRQLMDVDLIPLIVFIISGSVMVCLEKWPKKTIAFIVVGLFTVGIIECILYTAQEIFKDY